MKRIKEMQKKLVFIVLEAKRELKRDNVNNREGQPDSTPVGKYHFTWTTKGVRYYVVNFNYRGPL